METALITGGAGFIGSQLSERLLSEGWRVVCLDNFDTFYDPQIKRNNISSALKEKYFTLIEGDIRDKRLLDNIFNREKIDVVIHIAARAGVRPSIKDPALYYDVNVGGTLNLLEAVRGRNVKKFIFASSSSVYGENTKVPFSEEDNVDYPISPYAATKKAGELLCYTYYHLYRIPITCLRFFTVYGPRQRPEMAIHKFTRLIYEGKPVPVFGDGSSKRDYTFIEDIIEGVVKSIHSGSLYEIINLGESNTISLSDLIVLIENNLHKNAVIEKLPLQPGDVPITYADTGKARSLLGYNPQTNIKEGIRIFTEWFLKQENRGI